MGKTLGKLALPSSPFSNKPVKSNQRKQQGFLIFVWTFVVISHCKFPFPFFSQEKCNFCLWGANQTIHTIQRKLGFASLWSSLGVRLAVETTGEWELKAEDFKSHITNREQNHRTTPGQETCRQDGQTKDTCLTAMPRKEDTRNKTIQRCWQSSS